MGQQQTDAQNDMTEIVVKQNLVLWQTAQSLIDIEAQLNKTRRTETRSTPSSGRKGRQWFKNLFTIFGSP